MGKPRLSYLGLLPSMMAFACLLEAFPSPKDEPSKAPDASPKLSSLDLQRESLKKQRDALRQQQGIKVEPPDEDSALLIPVMPAAQLDCPAMDSEEVDALIAAACKKQSLSPQVLKAVIRQESGFKPCAISVKGAQGLMQLMPATAAQMHVTDPFDPEQNIQGGAAFLKSLLKRYNGDLRLALVAYNAGATRADQLNASQYPQETQGYLTNIFAELGNPDQDPHGSEVESTASDPVPKQ